MFVSKNKFSEVTVMEAALAARSFWEVMIILVLTLAIYNEEKFIIFEMNVERIIKRKIRAHKLRKAKAKIAAQQKAVEQPVRKADAPQKHNKELKLFDVSPKSGRSIKKYVA